MKKFFSCLDKWFNAHLGFLAFFGIIAPFIAPILITKFNFTFTNSLLDKIFIVLSYKLKIPIFMLLLLCIAFLVYFLIIRRKYKSRPISMKFLVGTWRNNWEGTNFSGTEDFEITTEGDYKLAGETIFKIKNFEYDAKTSQIKFIKVGVLPNDARKLINILQLVNNDVLAGKEDYYNIKYTRLLN